MKETLKKLDMIGVYLLNTIFAERFSGLQLFGLTFIFSGLFNIPVHYVFIGIFLFILGDFIKLPSHNNPIE